MLVDEHKKGSTAELIMFQVITPTANSRGRPSSQKDNTQAHSWGRINRNDFWTRITIKAWHHLPERYIHTVTGLLKNNRSRLNDTFHLEAEILLPFLLQSHSLRFDQSLGSGAGFNPGFRFPSTLFPILPVHHLTHVVRLLARTITRKLRNSFNDIFRKCCQWAKVQVIRDRLWPLICQYLFLRVLKVNICSYLC